VGALELGMQLPELEQRCRRVNPFELGECVVVEPMGLLTSEPPAGSHAPSGAEPRASWGTPALPTHTA